MSCRGGALRRQADRRRLHDQAQVLQVADEFRRQPGLGLPADDVRIEPVPLAARPHPGADLGAGLDQALGHQRLDRLADHGTADTEFLAQQRLRRHGAGDTKTPGHDGATEVVHRIAVHVLDHQGTGVSSGLPAKWACRLANARSAMAPRVSQVPLAMCGVSTTLSQRAQFGRHVGLVGKHVERRAGDDAGGHGMDQRRLVDHRAARHVDQITLGAQRRQHLGVDQAARALAARRDDDQEIDLARQRLGAGVIGVGTVVAPGAGGVGDRHAEAAGAVGDRLADAAQARRCPGARH